MKKRTLALVFVLLAIVFGAQISGVSASFYGEDTAPYAGSDTKNASSFAVVTAQASSGKCKIKVNRLYFPYLYWGGTWSAAWVSGSETMSQSWTANWAFYANWDIDYRLQTADNAKVTLSIVFYLFDADGDKLGEAVAWKKSQQSQEWDDIEQELDDESNTEIFTTDLTYGHTYYFAVALKVYIHYNCRKVRVTARTDHSDPALLIVNRIMWTSDTPE
ncbi:MAG: hypothetical protein GF309_06800 [Candidatus Lokiarchaeota archaeon]|nr:hypothetical protein [Candidatus Lokiarchaeota archaeon]